MYIVHAMGGNRSTPPPKKRTPGILNFLFLYVPGIRTNTNCQMLVIIGKHWHLGFQRLKKSMEEGFTKQILIGLYECNTHI